MLPGYHPYQVGDATKNALSGVEQGEAAVARGMVLSGTLVLSLGSGASGAAEQEAARAAAMSAACGTNTTGGALDQRTAMGVLAATTCTVTIQGRRRLGGLGEISPDEVRHASAVPPASRRRRSFAQFRAQLAKLARDEIGQLISATHGQQSAPRRQLSAVPLTLSVSLSLDLERVGGGKAAAKMVSAVLASVGAAAAKALPGAAGAAFSSAAMFSIVAVCGSTSDRSRPYSSCSCTLRVSDSRS